MAVEVPSIGNIRDRLHQCVLGMYWHDQRNEWVESNLIYSGVHRLHDAAEGDTEWAIWKYTYNVSNQLIRKEGPLQGSWTGRGSLAWGA